VCAPDGSTLCYEEALGFNYGGRRLRDAWRALEAPGLPTGYFFEVQSADCLHGLGSATEWDCVHCFFDHGRAGMATACPACLALPEGGPSMECPVRFPGADADADSDADADADSSDEADAEADADAGADAEADAAADADLDGDGSDETDAGVGVDARADAAPSGDTSGGCGCRAPGAPESRFSGLGVLALALAAAAAGRRRRRGS
jgi:MYXO-CTERM domain-containing protein